MQLECLWCTQFIKSSTGDGELVAWAQLIAILCPLNFLRRAIPFNAAAAARVIIPPEDGDDEEPRCSRCNIALAMVAVKVRATMNATIACGWHTASHLHFDDQNGACNKDAVTDNYESPPLYIIFLILV